MLESKVSKAGPRRRKISPNRRNSDAANVNHIIGGVYILMGENRILICLNHIAIRHLEINQHRTYIVVRVEGLESRASASQNKSFI